MTTTEKTIRAIAITFIVICGIAIIVSAITNPSAVSFGGF